MFFFVLWQEKSAIQSLSQLRWQLPLHKGALRSHIACACTLLFKGKNPKKAITLYMVCYMVLMILLVMEMFIFGADGILIMLFVLGIICILLTCFLYLVYPRVQYNALHHLKNMENHFVFFVIVSFGFQAKVISTRGEQNYSIQWFPKQ